MRNSIALFFLLATWPWLAQSEEPTEKLPAKDIIITRAARGSQNLKIVYGSSLWNNSSTNPDSAFLFMRDAKSGKIAKVVLDETEPDSSVFSGNFSVSWDPKGTGIEPEIYIPPKTMKDNEDSVSKFSQLLNSGKIAKKPLVFRTDENIRVIDVYDTQEQAKAAQQAALEAQKMNELIAKREGSLLKKNVQSDGKQSSTLSTQDLEAAKKGEQNALLNQLALEAARRAQERIRLEQIEKQKTEERLRLASQMNAAQRSARAKEASAIAAQALVHYQNSEFQAAEEKFKRAVELDPDNKSYYFRYGVTLYRLEKYNEALVVIKLSPDTPDIALEKRYYLGLIHLKLKELDFALTRMREVGSAKDPNLSPSAAFYEGVILFTQEKYEEAKEPFERVLDTSNDPALDRQAEDFLDKLIALIQMKKAMSKRWFFNGSLGLTYDSNVLLASDSQTSQGTATADADMRLMLTGDTEYRPIYTQNHELGAKAFVYYMRSSKDEVSRADPMLVNFSAPYAYKGLAFGKGYKLAVKPQYELIYMDLDEDGAREGIMSSQVISADNTFVMRKDWFSLYTAEFRYDDSLSESSTGTNNADAFKSTLKTSQIFMIGKNQKEVLMATGGYAINSAKGDNSYYDRWDLGATYVRPTSWEANWMTGINYYLINYGRAGSSDSNSGRKDQNVTFTTGFTKTLKEWVSWAVIGSYISNGSNVESNQYSKYTILTTATFNYAL